MSQFISNFAFESLPSKVTSITSKKFPDMVTFGEKMWAIVFGAPWCGPCNAFTPVFNMVAIGMSDVSLKFGKVDCQADQQLCMDLRIPHYPHVIFFANGATHLTGEQNPEPLTNWLKDMVTKANKPRDEL